MYKINPKSITGIRIQLASPETIREWAERSLPDGTVVGEVTKSETILLCLDYIILTHSNFTTTRGQNH